jgi:hypothetical protein
MSDKKLTAKLSDGREHEIASEWTAKENDGYVFLVLKPLKREPREWWCVVRRHTSNPDYSAYFIAQTEEEAREMVRTWDMGERAEAVKVREVL